MRWTLALCLLLSGCSGEMAAPMRPPPVVTEPGGTPITVIAVGNSATDTLSEAPDSCCFDVVGPLRRAGLQLETLDAPCHGQDLTCNRAGLVGGLEGWAGAVTAGTDIFSPFCERLREQIGDRKVFVAGVSRGGYAVLRCDLGAPVRGIVTYAPVIDLYRLIEFANVPRVSGYELMPQRVPTLIRIGRRDDRVGTDAAVSYAQMTGAELQLLDSFRHRAPENGGGIEWIRAHL